jgi:hypothetical protein
MAMTRISFLLSLSRQRNPAVPDGFQTVSIVTQLVPLEKPSFAPKCRFAIDQTCGFVGVRARKEQQQTLAIFCFFRYNCRKWKI